MKKATLDSRHQYIFSVVATKLCLEESVVEDFALEGDQVRNLFALIKVLMSKTIVCIAISSRFHKKRRVLNATKVHSVEVT